MAGDTPFFPRDLAARLAAQGGGIVLAAGRDEGGRVVDHPTFGLWPVGLRDALRSFLLQGKRRVRGFAAEHGAAMVIWDTSPDPFFNVNTPEDLEVARRLRES